MTGRQVVMIIAAGLYLYVWSTWLTAMDALTTTPEIKHAITRTFLVNGAFTLMWIAAVRCDRQ